ncbi:Ribosomal protein L11 methyltransferase [Methylophaga frappieri]|uniref:Ribosomal protein L11 methyltransferase n=1 Tax=Methylophaga frappieri (strain ATCC BAA-2434 / DSM 25690 / JAM7) TaxID=754477 RepID=I1YJ71_METFJ|nr:50S ribosomal protein L11 methyltransferase [Methylophaga frappieri]AFJ02964.1 Ribosomal protein L11 methyltransferase [Methylophaga frappieri]
MAWVQFIFNTPPDAAESLSEALTDAGAAAVTFQDQADQPIYEPPIGETPLWSATQVVALFDANTTAEALQLAVKPFYAGALPDFKIEAVEDKDWERAWMDDFSPLCFGERLWIVPSWHTPPQPEAVNILLDPGLAFGTGTHPTTALCLRWLDKQEMTGKTVIDYGCGSGILAIAAALLGASKIIAVDTDPQALEATQENAKRNGVTIQTFLPDACPDITADVLLANILAGPLMSLAPLFSRLTHLGSDLVLSGILDTQTADIQSTYQSKFGTLAAQQHDEWMRLTGVRQRD